VYHRPRPGASKDAPAKDAPAAKDDKKAPADASKPIAAGAAKPTAAAAAAADKPADKPTSAPKDAPAAAKPDQQKQAEAPKADEPAAAAKVTPEVPKQDATKAAAPADKVAAAPAQKPAEQKPAEHKPGEHKPAEQKQGAPLKAADPKAPSQPAAKQPEAPLRNPADVSIFDVKKSNTPDGKVEVVLKPLVAPPVPRGAQPPAKSGDAPGKAATKSASDADANGPVVPPTSCKKTKISLHDADIAYTTGDSGLSVTKLSASCGAAASHTPALAGGCSLKCDYEEDLDKVTLVGDGPDGTSAANADKPATCR
jgi:hypothetical protein